MRIYDDAILDHGFNQITTNLNFYPLWHSTPPTNIFLTSGILGIVIYLLMQKRKYHINEKIMDSIDTEEKAYWLGFFYADAYNKEKTGQLIIELQERDRSHLLKCAKFFGQPREPFKQPKNKGKYTAYRLELNSRYLSNSLKSKGCHGAKSFNIVFPPWLDYSLNHHFIRGYFDGDGCIYVHQDQLGIEIISTKEMLDHIKQSLEQLKIRPHISHPEKYTNNTYRMDFGGSRQVKRFCDWIYQDAMIYLARKHDLFTDYCTRHPFRFDN
jgi:hypothetical protein